MKFDELDEVDRLTSRLLQSWGAESVCGRHLRKAPSELLRLRRKGGPVPRGTATRIVTEVCKVVCEELLARPDERK